MATVRQQIAQLLSQRDYSSRQLADALLIKPAEAEHHLQHLARSQKGRLQVEPARCTDCGYTFRGRKRLDAPGRCPQCKSQRIEGPWFRLA